MPWNGIKEVISGTNPNPEFQTWKAGEIADENYSETETNGTIVSKGEATCWDDFHFSVSNLRINPATSKPDFDYNEGEYLFDPATVETVVGDKISKHTFVQGQDNWIPHIHWVQSQAGVVVWQLQYKIWPFGVAEPSYTTVQTSDVVVTYVSGAIHQISGFAPIDTSGYLSTAMHVKVKISRLGDNIADTYPVDARFLGFDFHVRVDMFGSRNQFTK